jgi:hypothetical protein
MGLEQVVEGVAVEAVRSGCVIGDRALGGN